MWYDNVYEATFLERPNRFISYVNLDGEKTVCHVKNTGRCKELLTPGARVLIQHSDNPARKTAYDLIAVYKGDILINMDAAAPNSVVGEWLMAGGLGEVPTYLKAEKTWGASRFDFYAEFGGRKMFLEVKGVTLEDGGVARFPDAPTERGVKHLRELAACLQEGYEAAVVFVIQMKGVHLFTPNWATHAAFGTALQEAAAAGVKVIAVDCQVTPESLKIDVPVPVDLT